MQDKVVSDEILPADVVPEMILSAEVMPEEAAAAETFPASPVGSPEPTTASVFRSLRHRRFALLWGGQTISRVGDNVYKVALAWWVLQETGSAAAMGTVLMFSYAPMLVFTLLGGVAVDRMHRPRLMIGSDLARGAVALLVTGLALSGQLEVWQVIVTAVVFGVAEAFFQPAYMALRPELVPHEDLSSANALTSISNQAGRILGPALGGLVITAVGAPLAFGLNAASFFVSAALLLPLWGLPEPHRKGDDGEAKERAGVWQDLREGLVFVIGQPVLWVTILIGLITNVGLAGPYNVALPVLVQSVIGADASTLGFLYACFPAGYLTAALWLGRRTRFRRRGRTAYAGIIVAGLTLALFGFPLPIALLALAAFANGFALEVFGLIWTQLLQEMVPNQMLGRVSAIDNVGSFAFLPIAFVMLGGITDFLGPQFVFAVYGLGSAVCTAIGLLHPAIRKLD